MQTHAVQLIAGQWRALRAPLPATRTPLHERTEEPEVPAAPEVPMIPAMLGVLMRALAPFREARQAVVRAIREFEGLPPVEPLWTG